MLAFALALLPFSMNTCLAFIDESTAVDNATAAFPFRSVLLGSPSYSLGRRQGDACEVPGGPVCDSIHCCAPGTRCCPTGCCPNSSNCFNTDDVKCCPKTSQNCGGKACCPPGTTCCGNTCCVTGEICERSSCIDASLRDKVVRFEYNSPKNGELLRNMCNGMGGKNTDVLNYRGPDKAERDGIRQAAGCVDGYCQNLINSPDPVKRIPTNYDSCAEYPPANTLEGGNTRPDGKRAIHCIPSKENFRQGGKTGGFLTRMPTPLQRGDRFVISIDCDKVLADVMSKRDVIPTKSGNETVDTFPFFDNQTLSYLLMPLGDLSPGTYSATVQVTSGSTAGALVLDSDGDYNITTNDAGVTAGQSQQYNFTLDYATFGVGVLLSTLDNATAVKWSLDGTTKNSSTSTSPSAGPSPPPMPGSSPGLIASGRTWAAVVALTWLLAFTISSY